MVVVRLRSFVASEAGSELSSEHFVGTNKYKFCAQIQLVSSNRVATDYRFRLQGRTLRTLASECYSSS